VKSGVIVEAVENQPWSGEANVHVAIANWVKLPGSEISNLKSSSLLIPSPRKLWHRVAPSQSVGTRRRVQPRNIITATRHRGGSRADKLFELGFRDCEHITSALSDATDLSAARTLSCNSDPQRSFNGQMLGHDAFLLDSTTAHAFLRVDPSNAEVIHPYLNGREFLAGDGRPSRFVLDLGERTQLEAARYSAPFEHVKTLVLPDRKRKAHEGQTVEGRQRSHHKGFLERWWQLSFGRPELCRWLAKLRRYLTCSLVTKRAIFVFVDSRIRPSNLLQVFTFDDDYSFGTIQSDTHWAWFRATSSKLKTDYRFGESVWNTFPWPQSPTKKQINAVAAAGREVRRIRAESLPNMKGGLRALYRTLELPGKNPLKDAHAALDAAVLDAYGFSPRKDLLKQLLDLNLAVAARIDKGEPVAAPGVPPSYADPADLITDDCIRP
jgi:hypothetical protein